MNIIQSYAEVRRLLDRVRSPRYDDNLHLDPALNTAVRTFTKDRYDNIKKQTGYSFQSSERLREELYTLVTDYITPTVVSGRIQRPADFMYLVDVRIKFVGLDKWISASPATYNNEQELNIDPFSKPDNEKFYVNESELGIRPIIDPGLSFSQIEYCYVRIPKTVYSVQTNIPSPGPLIIGNEYYVVVTAIHDGVTYNPGSTFIAVNTVLTSGSVWAIQSIPLPVHTHDEIHLLAYREIAGINQTKDKIQNAKDELAES